MKPKKVTSSNSTSNKKKPVPKLYSEWKPEPMMVDYPPDPMYYGGKLIPPNEPSWID